VDTEKWVSGEIDSLRAAEPGLAAQALRPRVRPCLVRRKQYQTIYIRLVAQLIVLAMAVRPFLAPVLGYTLTIRVVLLSATLC